MNINEGYIRKEEEMVQKLSRLEDVHLHEDFNYRALTALSAEARQTRPAQTPDDRAGQPNFGHQSGGCKRVADPFGAVEIDPITPHTAPYHCPGQQHPPILCVQLQRFCHGNKKRW